MGTQAFWLSQSSPSFYVVEQTDPSQVNCVTTANELEHEVFAPPYKNVPVGQEFQAEVPLLILKENSVAADSYDSDSEKWLGEHVWSRNDDAAVSEKSMVLQPTHGACSCPSPGTLDCVRLHIEENRRALKDELAAAFYKWGFHEMGEVVAEHWTQEEELLFQQSVRRNPSSFWRELYNAFPSKETREMVSYYFNVFVLRKRAIQNRLAPSNVDSDDEEIWLDSDDEEGSGLIFESDRGVNGSQVDEAQSDENDIPTHYLDGSEEDLDDISSDSNSGNDNAGAFGNYASPLQGLGCVEATKEDIGQPAQIPDHIHESVCEEVTSLSGQIGTLDDCQNNEEPKIFDEFGIYASPLQDQGCVKAPKQDIGQAVQISDRIHENIYEKITSLSGRMETLEDCKNNEEPKILDGCSNKITDDPNAMHTTSAAADSLPLLSPTSNIVEEILGKGGCWFLPENQS